MDIQEIKHIALKEGEVLWVVVPRNNLSRTSYLKHVDEVRQTLSLLFVSNRILITPEGYNIEAISAGENNDRL